MIDTRRKRKHDFSADGGRMARVALLLTIITGCSNAWDPSDFPGAPVITFAPSGQEAQWRTIVEQTMLQWELALEPYECSAPFRFAERWENAYPVKLVTARDWTEPGLVGATWHNRIEIIEHSYAATTLAHEFGHAMGLGHHDDRKFGPSIMFSGGKAARIEDRDARAAACALGCGPCDTIDEYSE